jgi:flagellar hook-basal body complex protein FliE
MKNTAKILGTLILGLTCSLWLTGCGDGHDHAGHDHDHDHGEEQHEESTGDTASQAVNQIAGTLTEAANTAADAANKVVQEAEKMTDEAIIAAQSATYPLKKCVVSGEALGSMGETVNYVHEGTLIRLCCDHCKPDVEKDPAKFVAMVTEAATK